MLPFAKFHPATLVDLHTWSTLSRNEIRPFLTRFGIEPLGSKYPMLRVYEAVLGLSPDGEVEEKMLGQGLIRVSEAASMIGLTPRCPARQTAHQEDRVSTTSRLRTEAEPDAAGASRGDAPEPAKRMAWTRSDPGTRPAGVPAGAQVQGCAIPDRRAARG